MSILVNIDDNLDFCQHFRKISILVTIFGIIELGQNFPPIFVLVKISEKCRFRSKFKNMSILVKIYKNLETSQNLKKYRCWSKLSEILDFTNKSILDKIALKCCL